MSLTRRNVSPGMRLALPLFVIVNLGYGLALSLEALPHLLDVPAYRTLDTFVDLRVWGWLFITVGAVQAAALLIHRADSYIYSLGVGFILGAALTAAFTVGAAQNTNPWTAPWLPLLYAGSCVAAIYTLGAHGR